MMRSLALCAVVAFIPGFALAAATGATGPASTETHVTAADTKTDAAVKSDAKDSAVKTDAKSDVTVKSIGIASELNDTCAASYLLSNENVS